MGMTEDGTAPYAQGGLTDNIRQHNLIRVLAHMTSSGTRENRAR
jgi:hypothetical protein